MARLHHLPPARRRRTGSRHQDARTRTTLPAETAGRGLSLRERRAHAIARPTRVGRLSAATRRSAQAVSTAAQSRFCSVRFGRNALRQDGRTATEARVRSPSEDSAVQAETERWSGSRTRDTMINSHLLYPSELSLCTRDRNRTDTFRFFRPVLSMSYILHPRAAKHDTGDRYAPVGISESPHPSPQRRSGLIREAQRAGKCTLQIIFGSTSGRGFTDTACVVTDSRSPAHDGGRCRTSGTGHVGGRQPVDRN